MRKHKLCLFLPDLYHAHHAWSKTFGLVQLSLLLFYFLIIIEFIIISYNIKNEKKITKDHLSKVQTYKLENVFCSYMTSTNWFVVRKTQEEHITMQYSQKNQLKIFYGLILFQMKQMSQY